jgi:hypothetical protein
VLVFPNFPIYPIGLFPNPKAGDFLAAITASAFLGAFPPVDFLAVYLVLAPPLSPLVLVTSSRSCSFMPSSSSSFSPSSSSFSSSSP